MVPRQRVVVETLGESMISNEFLRENARILGEEKTWAVVTQNNIEIAKDSQDKEQLLYQVLAAALGVLLGLVPAAFVIYASMGKLSPVVFYSALAVMTAIAVVLIVFGVKVMSEVPHIQKNARHKQESQIKLFNELFKKK